MKSTSEPPKLANRKRKPAPSVFFEGGAGIRAHFLAEQIERDGPIGAGPYGELYYYQDGLWVPNGEREVRDRTRKLLDDRYRQSHGTNAVEWFKIQPPRFGETESTRYLNLPNGLLDWRTGVLSPHNPDVGNLPRIPIEWDPDAECPVIDEWLYEVLPEDCVELAYEIFGYEMFNGNPLHKAALLFGAGRNGKGTFLRLSTRLVGTRNVSSVTPQSLDDNRFMTAELYGKLANLVGDVDPRVFKATEKFKQATGGDLMTAERKNGQPFSFWCKAFMVAAFNELPRSADTTEGFLSRWVVLPFTGYFPEGKSDSSIEDKMSSGPELQGLLVAAVAGLRTVIGRHAFSRPDSVREATAAFRVSADPVREFLLETTKADRRGSVARAELYRRYALWAEANGYAVETRRAFYGRVRAAASDVLGAPITEGKAGVDVFRGLRFAVARPRIKAAKGS